MTAAGATINSWLSTRIHSKHTPSSDSIFRISCARTLQVTPISHVQLADYLSISSRISHKWRNLRIASSVTEEQQLEGAVEEDREEVVEEVSQGEVEAEPEPQIQAPTSTKLYFGNLPYNCDSAQLAGIIQDYANPELVEVLYDRATGRSRGFAFVTMSSMEDCNAVIQSLDGSLYGGRPLRVNLADKPKPKEPLYPETEYKLFVGNLSWSVTSESLTEAFQGCGNVVGARVLYDGDTGRSRGYGFVCFSSKQEMDAALNSLDGVELDGRAMRVSVAQGKKTY